MIFEWFGVLWEVIITLYSALLRLVWSTAPHFGHYTSKTGEIAKESKQKTENMTSAEGLRKVENQKRLLTDLLRVYKTVMM